MADDTKLTDAEAARIAARLADSTLAISLTVDVRRDPMKGREIVEVRQLAAWVLDQFESVTAEGPSGLVSLPALRKTPTWAVEALASRRCATCANFRKSTWQPDAECTAIHRDSDAASTIGPRLTVAPTFGCVLWTPRAVTSPSAPAAPASGA